MLFSKCPSVNAFQETLSNDALRAASIGKEEDRKDGNGKAEETRRAFAELRKAIA